MLVRNSSDPIPVVLTIDTEPDNTWDCHLNSSVMNVRQLLRLQEVLSKYCARATCLITYKVVQNDDAVSTLEEMVQYGGAEIGAHLHPWDNPPFMASGDDVKYATYPHELPLSVFEDKLSALTSEITKRLETPTSYRAGRWGLVADHLYVLERLGYHADTSVIPLVDWRPSPGIPASRYGRGGIDYRFAPQHPYHPAYTDVTRPGGAKILEVPVTVAFTRRTPALIRKRYGAIPVIVQRVLRKSEILRPVWATPAEESSRRLARMIAVSLAERAPLINIAIHSSELMVGGSPQTRTTQQVNEVFARIDALLETLASTGTCLFTTLSAASHMLS